MLNRLKTRWRNRSYNPHRGRDVVGAIFEAIGEGIAYVIFLKWLGNN